MAAESQHDRTKTGAATAPSVTLTSRAPSSAGYTPLRQRINPADSGTQRRIRHQRNKRGAMPKKNNQTKRSITTQVGAGPKEREAP